LPLASLVTFSVTFAVPVTVDSALVTGGTSFAGESDAVNTGFAAGGVVVGDVEFFVHPAAITARATARTDRRFMV
jgi:hypothetical protein